MLHVQLIKFSYILMNKQVNLDILHVDYDFYLGLSTHFFLLHTQPHPVELYFFKG